MTEENPILPGTSEAGIKFGRVSLTNRGYDEPNLETDKKSSKLTHDIMWTYASEEKKREMILAYFEFRGQIATEDIVSEGIQKRFIELNDRFKRYLRILCIDKIVNLVKQKTTGVKEYGGGNNGKGEGSYEG